VSPEREATSTYEEAVIMRDFLKVHPSSQLILVTSKYHSARAYLTFRSALDDREVRIRSCPTPYDPLIPSAGGSRRRCRRSSSLSTRSSWLPSCGGGSRRRCWCGEVRGALEEEAAGEDAVGDEKRMGNRPGAEL